MKIPETFGESNEKAFPELGSLAIAIQEYNREHGMGAIAADIILGAMRSQEDSGDEEDISREASNEKPSLSGLRERFKQTLAETGLSIEPVRGNAVYSNIPEREEQHATEIRINIANHNKFLQYLEILSSDTISDMQISGLRAVAESLTQQLKTEYELTNADDERMMELFASLDHLIAHYRRLDPDNRKGLSRSVSSLENHWIAAKGGYLRERLRAEKEQLLDEVGGENFGPSKWHQDMGTEEYERKWNRVVDTTKEIRQNPKAESLVELIVKNLLASIDYARIDIDSL